MKTLLVDIGNSRIKARVVDDETGSHQTFDATATDDIAGFARTLAALHEREVARVFVSNVASDRTRRTLSDALEETLPAARVAHVVPGKEAHGVVNGYREPAQLGSDRWLAMIGAHALVRDRPLLVCSFGTATTLDLLELRSDGRAFFAGGAILPGASAMARVLETTTARLTRRPGEQVGFADNTGDAIASGIALAQVGAVVQAVRRARDRLPVPALLECVVAGGAVPPFLAALNTIGVRLHVADDVVLAGLGIVAMASRSLAVAAPCGLQG